MSHSDRRRTRFTLNWMLIIGLLLQLVGPIPPALAQAAGQKARNGLRAMLDEPPVLPTELQPAATGAPQLAIEIALERELAAIGETVPLTMHIVNQGQIVARGYSLELYLTDALALADGSQAPENEPVKRFTLPDIRPGASQVFEAIVQLTQEAADHGVISLVGRNEQDAVVATAYAHLENAANGPTGSPEVVTTPEPPGGWTFRPNPPQTSLFSGAATYNYPLDVPPARRDLGPAIGLGYSSRSTDGIRSWVDSGEFGEGWQLNGVPFIMRNGVEHCNESVCADFSYTLYMDGMHLLKYQGQENNVEVYQATDAPGLRVELHNDATPWPAVDAEGNVIDPYDPGNFTGQYWIVRAPGGKVYRFGHRVDSEQLLFRMTDDDHAGRIEDTGTYRWWLDQADDAFGNQMVILYKSFAAIGGYYGCDKKSPPTMPPPGEIRVCRDTAVYPEMIRYNNKVANPDHRNPADWQSTVQFHMTTQGLDPVYNNMPMFRTAAKVHTITMHHNGAEVWRYELGQVEIPCGDNGSPYCSNNAIRRVLQSIIFKNRDAADNLQSWPPALFEYEQHQVGVAPSGCDPTLNCTYYKYPHLLRAHNGYGGVYEFQYAALPSQNDTKSWFVTDLSIWDGVRHVYGQDAQAQQHFHYLYLPNDACYDKEGECHDWTVPGSEASHKLVGFRWLSVLVYDETGTFQGRTNYHFGVEDNIGHPLLFGRELARWQYADEEGQILLNNSQNTWATGPAEPCPSSALTWVCLASSTNATYELVPGGASSVLVDQNQVVYGYEVATQGGRQWGLLTKEAHYYWDGSAFQPALRQRNVYADNDNPAHWIVAPIAESVWDDASTTNSLRQMSLMLYDDNLDPNSQVLQRDSLLSWSRAVADVTPLYDTGATVNVATADTHYEYTVGGLLQQVTTFGEYGNQQAVAGADWLPVAPGDFAAADQATTHSTFSADGLVVTAVTDPAGHQTTYQYNGETATTPWSMTEMTFNPGPAGQTTQYRYDEMGRLRHVIAPGASLASPSLQYGYTVFAPTVEVDTDTHLIEEVHYSGMPIMILEQTNPAEGNDVRKISRTAYDGLGVAYESRLVDVPYDDNPDQQTDLSTATERSGRLVCRTLPLVTDTAPPAEICGNAGIEHQETLHDMLGRPIQHTAADGSVSTVTFATPGMAGVWVGHANLGGVSQSRHVETGNDGVTHRISYHTYDAFGRLAWSGQWEEDANCTNGRLHLTLYGYDSLDNLTLVERGATLCGAHYDHASVVTTEIEYDSLGRKVKMTDPDMGTWVYVYNPAGAVVAQTGGVGTTDAATTCAHYDVLGRLTDQWLGQPNGQCGTIPMMGDDNFLAHTSYVTDPANPGLGQVQSVVYDPHIPRLTGDFSDSFFYDNLGRLSSHSRVLSGRSYLQQILSYDRLARPLLTVNPAGETETTAYDYWGGQSLTVYSGGQTQVLVEEAIHNLRGQLAQLQRGNGVDSFLDYYDVARGFRLRDVDVQNSAALLANYHYDYDSAGQIIGLHSLLQGNLDEQQFSYDTLGRLKTATAYENGSNFPAYNYLYEYDNLGNLVALRDPVSNQALVWYENHPQHPHAAWRRHEAGQTFEYGYNSLGQMTSREALDPASGQPVVFEQRFDELGRLIEVEKSGDGETQLTSFAYDPAGLRMVTVLPDGAIVYTPFAGYEERFSAPWVEVPVGEADLTAPDHTGWTLATVQEPAGLGLVAGTWNLAADPDYPATSISNGPGVGEPYSAGGQAVAVSNLASGAIESNWQNLPVGSSEVMLRLWVRGQLEGAVIGSSGLVVELDLRWPNGTILTTQVWNDSSLNQETWQRIVQSVNVGLGPTQVRVRLAARQAAGWVAFDDLALVSGGQVFYSTGFEMPLGWSELSEPDFPATFIWRGDAGPAAPRSGQYSFALGNLMFTNVESPPVPVAAGQQYMISALARGQLKEAPDGTFTLAALYYDSGGGFLGEETVWQTTKPQNSWEAVGGLSLAPAGADTMVVRVQAAYLGGLMAVDDVCVETGWLPVCWDFEDGNQGWTKSNNPAFPAGAAVTLPDEAASLPDEENSYYGLTNGAGGVAQSGLLPVVAGRMYQVSAQVRGQSSGSRMVATFYDMSGILLESQVLWSDAQADGSRAWNLVQATFTIPAGATQARLGLEGAPLSGWRAVDSMSLAALSEPVTIGGDGWEYEAGVLVQGNVEAPEGQDALSLGVIYYDVSGEKIGQETVWSASEISFLVPSHEGGPFTTPAGTHTFRLVQAMNVDNDVPNNWVGFSRPILWAIGAPITVQSGRLYELAAEVQGEMTAPPGSFGTRLLARFYDAGGNWLGGGSFWQSGSGTWTDWTTVGGQLTVPADMVTMRLVQEVELSDGWLAYQNMTLMALSEAVTVTAGSVYSLTATVSGVLNTAAGENGGQLVALFYDQDGELLGNPAVAWSAGSFNQPEGTEVGGLFTVPLGAARLRVRMESHVNYGWLDFADTSLKVSQQPAPVERISYSLDGRAVALRLTGNTADAGLYYPHGDHLGSVSLISYGQGHAQAGQVVPESLARYLPFGGYRDGWQPTVGLTDRGYTGHKHNDDLGLIYMNARYYDPVIRRFVSADTIVPDPTNPQSYNRYSYGYNNPVKYADPTGHKACELYCSVDEIDPTLGIPLSVLSLGEKRIAISADKNLYPTLTDGKDFIGDKTMSIRPVMVDNNYVTIDGEIAYEVTMVNFNDPEASGLNNMPVNRVWTTESDDNAGILRNFVDAITEYERGQELRAAGNQQLLAGVGIGLLTIAAPTIAIGSALAEIGLPVGGFTAATTLYKGMMDRAEGEEIMLRAYFDAYSYFYGDGGLLNSGTNFSTEQTLYYEHYQ